MSCDRSAEEVRGGCHVIGHLRRSGWVPCDRSPEILYFEVVFFYESA